MGFDGANEFAILRRRMDALEHEAYRRAQDSLGGSRPRSFVGRVFDGGAMPDVVPAFYKVQPVMLDGDEDVGEVVSASDEQLREGVDGPTPLRGTLGDSALRYARGELARRAALLVDRPAK